MEKSKYFYFLLVGLVILLLVVVSVYLTRSAPVPQPVSQPRPESVQLTPTEEKETEMMEIKVYFGNSELNKELDCSKVFPVSREIPKTQAVAKVALNELFAGPTESEKKEGYTSFFSDQTRSILKSVKVQDETAYIDLTDIRLILSNASTSCGSAAFLAEVETTLKQFPTVQKVIIAIDGKPATFYEWIQVGCPAEGDLCDEDPFK